MVTQGGSQAWRRRVLLEMRWCPGPGSRQGSGGAVLAHGHEVLCGLQTLAWVVHVDAKPRVLAVPGAQLGGGAGSQLRTDSARATSPARVVAPGRSPSTGVCSRVLSPRLSREDGRKGQNSRHGSHVTCACLTRLNQRSVLNGSSSRAARAARCVSQASATQTWGKHPAPQREALPSGRGCRACPHAAFLTQVAVPALKGM